MLKCLVRKSTANRYRFVIRRLAAYRFVVLFSVFILALSAQAQAPNTKKILVLGDSLSAAYKLPKEDGWVHLLKQRLVQYGHAVEIVNASVSGITTAAGLKILPGALKQHTPQIVVIELGANDGLQGKPLSYIKHNLNKLTRMALKANAKVLILGVKLPPNRGKRYTEPFFKLFETVATKNDIARVPFMLEGVAGNKDLMQSDGLHPKAKGQYQVFKNILPHIEKLLID